MRTTFTSLSFAALASLVKAGGSIDNSAEANSVISAASTLSGSGSYIFSNVATGQTLSFVRGDSVTNVFPNSGNDPLELQFQGTAVRLSGGNNKCISAQWSTEVEGGVDYAAVSYACAVGSGQSGTASLEKTKQWWYLVPAGGSDGGNSNPDPTTTEAPRTTTTTEAPAPRTTTTTEAPVTTTTQAPRVTTTTTTEAEVSSTEAASTSASPFGAPRLLATSNSTAVNSTASTNETYPLSHELGYYVTDNVYITNEMVNITAVNATRATWICRHPGWWLANHPDYITAGAGHEECANDLAAYLKDQAAASSSSSSSATSTSASASASASSGRHARRSRPNHHVMAAKLQKRAQQFYIIPQDHLHDMSTRAVGSGSLSTYGGYTSTVLQLWNKGDKSQLWTITSA